MKAKKVLAWLLASATILTTACGQAAGGSAAGADTTAAADAGESATSDAAEADTEAGDAVAADADTEAESDAGESGLYEAEDLSDIIPEETVTLDVYDQLANYSGEQIGWFAKVLLDKFNIKMNIIPESDGTFETRMESGNLGDLVIWGSDTDDYVDAVDKGMLFDWNEDDLLTDYGPYIADNYQLALQKNQNLNKDGKIYGYGFDVATSPKDRSNFMYEWDLRFDLYEQLGSPAIGNLDDLVDVLQKMQEACPTDDNGNPTYGVSLFNDWDGDMVMFVKSTATAYYGYDEFGIGLYNPTDGKYHPALEEDGPYLTCLKFYNKLYQAGLLDPDSQTQGYDGMVADYQNGTAFLNIFDFLGSAFYNTDTHMADGKAMLPVKPADAVPICYGQNIYGGNRIWSIGANTEYPELCMAILNWLSTPEGSMTMWYGPKDTCWYYDENGKTHFTDLGQSCFSDVKTDFGGTDGFTGTFEDGSAKVNNTTYARDSSNPDANGEKFNSVNWESNVTEPKYDIEKEWRSWAGADSKDAYMGSQDFILSPGSTYSGGVHSDELQVKWDQVTTCLKDNSWKAIYAKSDDEYDKIVAQMIKDCEGYGYDECVEFQENEATLRYAAEQQAQKDAEALAE